MKTLVLALYLVLSLYTPAHAQSLWLKEAIVCQTEDQARATIALNNGAVSPQNFKFAHGCRVRVVEFVQLEFIEPSQIWNGIRFKVVWIAVHRMAEDGAMQTLPYVSLFTIVWEEPSS